MSKALKLRMINISFWAKAIAAFLLLILVFPSAAEQLSSDKLIVMAGILFLFGFVLDYFRTYRSSI